MSNKTDLDWLARNVHEWPEGKSEVLVCWPRNVDTLIWSYVLSDTGWITKGQWLARRAELQNKPSWGSVGSDINFISQHDDGQWIGHSEKPSEADECFECNCVVSLFGYGEVLGDWRDTLEKRPEEFKPLTSIEDNQEQDMKQDNGWHERGELPPVGVECEIDLGAKWRKAFVVGHNYTGRIVVEVDTCDFIVADGCTFRPIRTERDDLIEMLADFDGSQASAGAVADAILAAGFKRGAA